MRSHRQPEQRRAAVGLPPSRRGSVAGGTPPAAAAAAAAAAAPRLQWCQPFPLEAPHWPPSNSGAMPLHQQPSAQPPPDAWERERSLQLQAPYVEQLAT